MVASPARTAHGRGIMHANTIKASMLPIIAVTLGCNQIIAVSYTHLTLPTILRV